MPNHGFKGFFDGVQREVSFFRLNLRIWLLNGALAGKILEKMAGRILLRNRFLNILEFQSAPKNGA